MIRNKIMKSLFSLLMVTIILVLVFGCEEDLEIIDDIKYSDYQLLDIDSNNVVFPKILNGKIGIVGYIFTNCPDICPLTTNNMRLAQEKLIEHNIADIEFVSISFDPEVDKPSVLKSFANIRNLDLKNWNFLTGEKVIIDKLMKKIGVVAFVNDSTQFENGLKTYFYVHTDRIQLIDKDGRIRKNYLGSQLSIDELVADVKKLL